MAILLRGKTRCLLCSNVIRQGEQVVSFPTFVTNEADPLWVFSDRVFHATCFHRHPSAGEAAERYEEVARLGAPGKRMCAICGREILEPNEHFPLGHVTNDRGHPLHQYNYAQFHRSCLQRWPDLPFLYTELQALNRQGAWRGRAPDWVLGGLGKELEGRAQRGMADGAA